jgi:hypothetical protein
MTHDTCHSFERHVVEYPGANDVGVPASSREQVQPAKIDVVAS